MGALQPKAANSYWTLLILLLVGRTLARNVFYPQTEYKYEYTGQVTAGIPSVNNEVNGVGIKCDVIIQGDNNDITVQLANIHSFSGVTVDGNTSKEVPMYYRPQSLKELEYPFKISYDGDQLSNVEVANNDIQESVNIKKALAILLTIRLDNYVQSRTDYSASQRDRDPRQVFQVEEDGYEGRCLSRYTYEKLQWPGKPYSQVLNITKKRDSDRCRERSSYKLSINEPKKCVGCESESLSFLNYGHKAQYNLYEEGGKFVLETAECFGRGAYTPFPPDGESIKAKQYQKLTLLGITQSSRRNSFSGTGTQHRNLGITPEEIELKARYRRDEQASLKTRKPFTETYSAVKQKLAKSTKQQTPLERAQTILDSSVADCRDLYNCTMELGLIKVTNIVDQLRRCNFNELRQFYATNIHDESKRKVVIDSLAMAGTNDAILVIKKLIEERKLTGESAVQTVSSLPAYVLEPQPAILEELWALCKDQLMQQSRQLFVTTMLAFGEMANQACAPKESLKTVKPYVVKPTGCPPSLVNKYLQELMNMYEGSTEPWQRSTIMFAISKMGQNQTLDYLAPYYRSKIFSLPIGHRIEMMIALFEIGPSRQDEVIEYILPIFYNKTLSSEERIVAFDVLAYITTYQDLINELAMSTWEEPSSQVAAYIYTYMKSLAELKTPCWKPMALRSEKALPLAKPVKTGAFDSGLHMHLAESEKWGLHSTFGLSMVRSSSSLTPRLAAANLVQEVGGYYYSLFEVISLNDGLQKVLDNLIGPKADFTSQTRFSDIFKQDEEPQTENRYHASNDEVTVTPRNEEPLYSRLSLTYLQDRHRLFFLDKYILDDIKESEILPPNKDLFSSLRDGIPINYRKHLLILDNQLKFSSIIGTPITITAKMPAIISIEGEIKAEASKAGIRESLSSFFIKPQITTTVGLSMWAGLHMEDVFDKTVKSAGVASKMFLEVPLKGQINADLMQQTISIVHQNDAGTKPSHRSEQRKPYSPFSWKVLPLLSSYDQETGQHNVYPLKSNNDLYNTQMYEHMGTWSITQDTNQRDRNDRKLEQDHRNYLEYTSLSWVPRHFSYEEVSYGDSTLLTFDEIEMKINWKHTASPYEAELWKDKTPLQQLRPWNFIPEWKNSPVTCSDIDPRSRLEVKDSTPRRNWFGRLTDKVKSKFGRSGGSDDSDEEDEQNDDNSKDDDKTEETEEDRGRGLHPHHKESGSDSGSQYGGQTHGTIRASYGASYSGQFTGQTTHESSGQATFQSSGQATYQTSGQSSSSQYGGESHSQRSAGGQQGISQTYGGGDDDWTQRTGDHEEQDIFTQQSFHGKGEVGDAHGQISGYPKSIGEPGRVVSQKKSTISRLKSGNEASQTVVVVQVTAKHQSEQLKANMEITLSDNVAQASRSISANLALEKNRKTNAKICFNGQFLNGYKECPQQDSSPSFDMKLSWGDSKCNNDKNFVALKGTYGVRSEDKNLWNNYRYNCGDDKKSQNCLNAFNKATTLTKATYELRYTEGKVNDYLDDIVMHIIRDHPEFAVQEHKGRQKTDDGHAVFDTLYNLDSKTLDLSMQRPHGYIAFVGIPYEEYLGLLGPRNRATSLIHQLGNDLANGEITTTCVVTPETVNTFSGLSYNYTLQSCPLIVAKDCSSSNLFTVTASDSAVTVNIYGHRIESSPNFGQSQQQNYPEVLIDGKVEQIKDAEISVIRSQGEEDVFVAAISASRDSVTIKSPPMGLIVTFTKTSMSVKVSQFWKGKVCGICGEDVDDVQRTFLGPSRCLYAQPEAFARSYSTRGRCGGPSDTYGSQKPCIQQAPQTTSFATSEPHRPNTGINNYGGPGHNTFNPPYETSQTTQIHGSGSVEGGCYVRRNQVKRKSSRQASSFYRKVNKVCFSTEAIRQCQQSCAGSDFVSVNVKFQCYDETSSVASELLAVVDQRPLTEMAPKDIDFEEEVMIAQKCIAKY